MKSPAFNGAYDKNNLQQIAFPLGGIGAGMFCVRGTGMPGKFALCASGYHLHSQPDIFAALTVIGAGGNVSRVLEGQIPRGMVFGGATDEPRDTGGNGQHLRRTYGLPRFREAVFSSRFPFATISLSDEKIPLTASLTAWSPFTPPEPDDSSCPLAYMEYTFENPGHRDVEAVFYFNSMNFLRRDDDAFTSKYDKGFILRQPCGEANPAAEAAFAVFIDDDDACVDTALFRGGWWDTVSMLWGKIERGESYEKEHDRNSGPNAPGGSLSLAFSLAPGMSRTIRVQFAWHMPETTLRFGAELGGDDTGAEKHKPWYAAKFNNIEEVVDFSKANVDRLFGESKLFSDTFYSMDLPDEVLEAAASNLSILKSPTIMRQTDGRLWGFEGCFDTGGVCPGSCTHVWNYAQSICNLFPSLERSLRRTEFFDSQDENGHQQFRASLPIRSSGHDFRAAADGQLGGIVKLYRDFTISGDIDFLREFYPKAKSSMEYCIETWDPGRKGYLAEPQHNTYDIEFWGPNSMLTSFYLGALNAMTKIGEILGEDTEEYARLHNEGREYAEKELFNGEYFYQRTQWEGLKEELPEDGGSSLHKVVSTEAAELSKKEGPKYQYGIGCLSDGVLGDWLARLAGIIVFSDDKVKSHLTAVHRYNLKHDLREHANPQRAGYAVGDEGGLLLCTWPKGGKPSLPFVYSDEVWTGIEYQAASHLMMMGEVEAGLEIVRLCRDRYDGEKRNPFNEYECGNWYARAMASYALIEALTGVRYDAYERVLYVRPRLGRFTSFLAADKGYAVCKWDGREFKYDVIKGSMDIRECIVEA